MLNVDLGYNKGLKDLQPSDIEQNNNRNRNVNKAIQGLVGRRTNRKDKGTEITKIEVTENTFQANTIDITYANGDTQNLTVNQFKFLFADVNDQ